jgi:lipoprotein-anchoring transpeptidase ErfK/SrfK
MNSRHCIALAAAGIGLALLAGQAAAQYQPPAPYAYPRGGYSAPLPDDDMTSADPDDDEIDIPVQNMRPVSPRSDYQQGAPYPYDPRAGRDANAFRTEPSVNSQPLPDVPAQGDAYRGPPAYGHYGDPSQGNEGAVARRPEGTDPAMRPPAGIEASRPPLPIDPGTGAPTRTAPGAPTNVASLPPDDQPEEGEPKELPPQFKRQVVDYLTKEPAGSIIIDTPSTYLYYVLGNGKAVRYGIGVGREGFTWSGTERITRVAEWPDWHPPAEMIERQPYLPRFMAGGPGNPLGARALYLGKTVYRIHGTNQPSTIGKFVSSGCIRMLNEDVEDLYGRVKVGTRVVVRPGAGAAAAASR